MVTLHVLEALCVLLLLTGVALLSVPFALILGGLLGALAIERATAQAPPPRRKEVRP
jgi:hypothetical protein